VKIIKVKSSQGCLGKNIGCEKAPDEIINALNKIYCSEEKTNAYFETDEAEVIKYNIEETNEKIEAKEGDIFIGGDHSITYGCFKGFAKKFKNPGLIVFDAHPDCVNNFKPPSHEDYLRVLIEEGVLNKENAVLIGLRNWHKNEIEFLEKNKIKIFPMKNLFNNSEDVCDTIMEIARSFDGLYISIDIDAVDPAFAPGTGYAEPGGMSSRELVYFIQRLKKLNNLRRADLVEINPDKDVNGMTVKLGAKIIKELI